MHVRRCPACSYTVAPIDEVPSGLADMFSAMLDSYFNRHIDTHVEDFRIEMELMSF